MTYVCYKSNLGEYLEELRNQQGLTQEVLAERMGITRSHISRIENGEKLPSPEALADFVFDLGLAQEQEKLLWRKYDEALGRRHRSRYNQRLKERMRA